MEAETQPAKMVTAASHLHNREAKRQFKVYANGKLLPFCQSIVPWGKSGQITHVPPPSREIVQTNSYLCHASAATCVLGMWRWR